MYDLKITQESSVFLFREAELLDDGRLFDWLKLLTEDIEYLVPIRVVREKEAGHGFSRESYHMKEDYVSIKTRITRLEHEYAWVENPPSRTRRMISNIRASADSNSEIKCKSNILLFRSHERDFSRYNLLFAERQDVLRRSGDDLKLAKRLVLLDHNILPMSELAVFL